MSQLNNNNLKLMEGQRLSYVNFKGLRGHTHAGFFDFQTSFEVSRWGNHLFKLAQSYLAFQGQLHLGGSCPLQKLS